LQEPVSKPCAFSAQSISFETGCGRGTTALRYTKPPAFWLEILSFAVLSVPSVVKVKLLVVRDFSLSLLPLSVIISPWGFYGSKSAGQAAADTGQKKRRNRAGEKNGEN
jgi:hypothetical protein